MEVGNLDGVVSSTAGSIVDIQTGGILGERSKESELLKCRVVIFIVPVFVTKESFCDFRHRALRHHAEGIFEAERVFGVTIQNSDGKQVVQRRRK